MLIDPATLRIAAVLDFEFTKNMPAQFAHDPPSWLLLRHPGVCIGKEGIDDFVKNYTPRLEQFLRATERAEDKVGSMSTTGPLLLIRMQEAWDSKQFWFKYALRRCLDVDAVYWAVLHESDDGDGSSLLDLATRETLPQVVQRKMEQLKDYEDEHSGLFSHGSSA